MTYRHLVLAARSESRATPDFHHGLLEFLTNLFRVDDDVDDDIDEDDDFGDDDDEDDEDEEEGDDEETETWQVCKMVAPLDFRN